MFHHRRRQGKRAAVRRASTPDEPPVAIADLGHRWAALAIEYVSDD
jgi:hypothetical protein